MVVVLVIENPDTKETNIGLAQPKTCILAFGPKSDTPHPLVAGVGENAKGETSPALPAKSN